MMKTVNLKKLAILGLTSGMALTAQGAFAETNSTNGTVLAAGCAHCGGFGASTKAKHQRDMDDMDDIDDDDGDLADNTGINANTPVQPIAPAPQTNPNSNINQDRLNSSGQFNSNQSNTTSNGQRRLDDQGMQRRLPVDSR